MEIRTLATIDLPKTRSLKLYRNAWGPENIDPSGARAASSLGAAPDPKPGLPTRSSAASVSGDPLDLDYSGVFDKMTAVLKCVPVYDHIPKPCREKFAHDLNALLTAVCNDPGDPAHWVRLHCFVPYVLQKTSRGGRRVNQGNLVNKRLSELLVLKPWYCALMGSIMPNHKSTTPIGGSTLCNLGLAESSPATFDKLCSIHPKIPVDRRVFPALTPTAGCVSPAEVLRAVKSFKNGSSGGLDGLRPQHLKDVFSGPLPIDDTLNSLTQFINLILSEPCPLSVRRLPKLMYFLRTSKHINPSKLGKFDGALRTALSSICNVQAPDGCTLIPWRAGRCFVTVPGTLAERYVILTSKECGLAAARAADEKMKKYGNALPSMEFLPICIEVLGPMDPNTLKFLNAICKMISVRSGDSRELFFATNHISCLLQRFLREHQTRQINLNHECVNVDETEYMKTNDVDELMNNAIKVDEDTMVEDE
ncbi:hypothetical protein HELRODRAFT_177636 [Helobdella robusta]|uniref:Uncharacterized protein n=1 Tax=Helobdella robusta TaxID=6412 RepID=T1FBZ4_HELRO|nr:hypothetical protein HELRODRAFT_177636 [Helobdella robusta]ESN97965.1 hypothetical protein HELRODRAFT_177636 [Helobdella robusta]